MYAVGLDVACDNHIFILSRGRHHGYAEEDAPDISKRIGKTTINEDHIGDFARTELTWPAGLAIAGDGNWQFNRPWGITIDTDGDIYVADWGNNRVQKFSPDGTYLLSFGSDPQGGGDLDHPCPVAVNSDGDVYVTDWGNPSSPDFRG